MIFVDEMKEMKIYNKPFFLPFREEDNKNGSIIYLLTPNYESSKKTMNLYYLINRRYFQSYYMEKNINYIINSNTVRESTDDVVGMFYADYLEESTLSSVDRNKLKDSDFGIPEKRKYPLHDQHHVLLAIKFFNYVDKNDEKELANNIAKAIDKLFDDGEKLDINIGDKNRLSHYIKKEDLVSKNLKKYETNSIVKESFESDEKYIQSFLDMRNSEILALNEDTILDNEFKLDKYLLNNVDESVYIKGDNNILFLEDAKYDPILRKLLYSDRIKQDKQILEMYKKIKSENDFIKFTYLNIPKYKGKNLYVDLSYYNQSFFKNNMYQLDKGVDLYLDLINRLINNSRFDTDYKKKTIFIPIKDWNIDKSTKMWMYKDGINPISVIFRGLTTNPSKIKEIFKDDNIIFTTESRYFKVNFSKIKDMTKFITKFKILVTKMISDADVDIEDKDDTANNIESKKAIAANIMDKLETNQGIKINALVGSKEVSNKDIKTKVTKAEVKASDNKSQQSFEDKEKQELIDAINKVAATSTNTDDALEKLENDKIKQIIIDLASQEEENVKINNARASRMLKLQNDMYDIKINNKTVKELLEDKPEEDKLIRTDLSNNISTINKEQWSNLGFINFDKNYDINSDIVKMLNKLSTTTYPIAVRNIKVEDNSTSEDRVDLYTVDLEDFRGKRFTIKFDVPKFRNDKYLLLRGNEKTIQNQFFNMPIIKTDDDTCQIISNYKKIFIRRFGTSSGKSYPTAGRLLKALNKYTGKQTKIEFGDCSKVSKKYELPFDYIDIGSSISKIENDKYIIFFNQDEIREKYGDMIDISKGLPIGIKKQYLKEAKSTVINDSIIYFSGQMVLSDYILQFLFIDEELKTLFDAAKNAIRYTYSKCSILNSEIPLIIVCAYSEGLETVLTKAHINYEMVDKLTKEIRNDITRDYIKFSDGYVVYDLNYNSSLLMNGLKESNTIDYSLADINSKRMYLDFLDNFGGRIKADGIENFYDCMIDPITEEVLAHYKLPTDYIEVLLHGNLLLTDNKFIKHTDTSSRRLRRKELIASKVYKAIFEDAYSSYATQLRHSRNAAQFTIKQSAVIDKFMVDSTSSDNSIINGINDVETANSVTTKGENGLNSDRAYSLDKRTYDESMLNLLGMSTGFAANVGITRQATIDMNIDGKRGYIKSINGNTDKLSDSKSLTITEALNPLGTTSDYPFRTAMNFIQTAKHAMRTDISDPLLVTNGSDEAMPYLVSDTFAYKAKDDCIVTDYVEDKYVIVEYKDGTKDYINLEMTIEKNSDGGFHVPLKLSVDNIKIGKKIKEGEVIAYDKSSFGNSVGESDNISYNVGTLAKIAIMNTDEGFEDSTILTENMCEKMATNVIVKEERILSKDTNIFNLVKVGQHVEEGDTLLVHQNSYDETDVNDLLKNLVDDKNAISELGRVPMKSHVTGTIAGVKLYRTVELDELSESLQKAFKEYEKPIKERKKILDANNIPSSDLPATYKLPPIGKLKNADDGVLIEIYINVHDIISVGDKIVIDRANKGICKDIIPKDSVPYTEFRPNEEVSCFANVSSFNKRMVTSPIKVGSINKALIELDRSVKDILGIPYDDSRV